LGVAQRVPILVAEKVLEQAVVDAAADADEGSTVDFDDLEQDDED
jgi:bifunctional DNase/RNase